MSEKFEPYNLEKAQEEAEKMQKKIKNGKAKNYDETEKVIEKESREKRDEKEMFIISKKEVGPYSYKSSSCKNCEKEIKNKKYYEVTISDESRPAVVLVNMDICSSDCMNSTEKNISKWMKRFYHLIEKTGTKEGDEEWLETNKKGVKKFFEDLREYYGDGKFRNESMKEILENKRILELGCGAPFFSVNKDRKYLNYYPHFCRILKRDYGADPVGVDKNCTINSVSKIDKDVEVHCLDATKDLGIKFKPNEFEIIFAYDATGASFGFENGDEQIDYLNNIYKILKQNGLYYSNHFEGGYDDATIEKMKKIGFKKIEFDTGGVAGLKPCLKYLIK